ncbi:MAG: hypothetical protein ACTHL8_09150 [Burkholderiaceae bacterium]
MSHPPVRKSLSVAHRLAWGFGALVGLSLVSSVVAGWQAGQIAAKVQRVVEFNNAVSDKVGHLRNAMDEMSIQARSVALMTEMKSINAEVDRFKAAKTRYQADEKALQALVAGAGGTDDERRIVKDVVALSTVTIPLVEEATNQAADGNNVEAALGLTNRVAPKETAWREALANLQKVVAADDAAAVSGARAA